MCVSDCTAFKLGSVGQDFFFETYKYAPSSKITQTCLFLSYYSLLIIWHAVQFVVPNIDQMYKEMKKIVEVGNKHGNGEKFPDFGDLFFYLA
jgi:hypothetical protein